MLLTEVDVALNTKKLYPDLFYCELLALCFFGTVFALGCLICASATYVSKNVSEYLLINPHSGSDRVNHEILF